MSSCGTVIRATDVSETTARDYYMPGTSGVSPDTMCEIVAINSTVATSWRMFGMDPVKQYLPRMRYWGEVVYGPYVASPATPGEMNDPDDQIWVVETQDRNGMPVGSRFFL